MIPLENNTTNGITGDKTERVIPTQSVENVGVNPIPSVENVRVIPTKRKLQQTTQYDRKIVQLGIYVYYKMWIK